MHYFICHVFVYIQVKIIFRLFLGCRAFQLLTTFKKN
jgi:hypothetical protein